MVAGGSNKETRWIIIVQIIIITMILFSIIIEVNLNKPRSKYLSYREYSQIRYDEILENDIYYIRDTISDIRTNDILRATYFNFTSMDSHRVRKYDVKYQPDSRIGWDLTDTFFQGDRVIVTIEISYVPGSPYESSGGSYIVEVVSVVNAQ